MTIELCDVDVRYIVRTNINDEGKNIVEILGNNDIKGRSDAYNVVLDYNGCQELIRVLQFVANEIKPNEKEAQ